MPVLHGDPRGSALDARARQRAAAGDERAARRIGARRRRRARGARSLPGMPRLQGRVPGRRRHGALQERVPRRLLAAARHAAQSARARPHPRAVALGERRGAARERGGAQRAGALAQRTAARPRSPPRAAGVDVGHLRAPVRAAAPAVCRPRRRCSSSTTPSPIISTRRSAKRARTCSRAPAARWGWRRTAAAAVRSSHRVCWMRRGGAPRSTRTGSFRWRPAAPASSSSSRAASRR